MTLARFIAAALLLAMVGNGYGLTREATISRLRQIVRLPSVTVESGFGFDHRRGFTALADNRSSSEVIEEIVREMKGTAQDAELYYRLGHALSETNQPDKAAEAFRKAVALYEQRVELQPNDGTLMAEFGLALWSTGEAERAEPILRQAVKIAPDEWRVWTALGRFLDSKSMRLLRLDDPPHGQSPKPEAWIHQRRSRPLDGEEIEQAHAAADEAKLCFARAVEAAPDEAEVYLHRALHHSLSGLRDLLLDQSTDRSMRVPEMVNKMFSRESLEDFKRASDLDPNNHGIVASTALFEAFCASVTSDPTGMSNGIDWLGLPSATRDSIRQAMARLEDRGSTARPEKAAAALEALAMLQLMILQDVDGSVANLRRAVALDPARDHAWDLLCALLARPGNYEKLLLVCQERIQVKDNLHNRIMLAKCYDKLGRADDARLEALRALHFSPEDFTANLALAALALKRGPEADALQDAGRFLTRANQVKEKSKDDLIQLILTLSIFYAYQDQTSEAQRMVEKVLQLDPQNDYAQAIKAALP